MKISLGYARKYATMNFPTSLENIGTVCLLETALASHYNKCLGTRHKIIDSHRYKCIIMYIHTTNGCMYYAICRYMLHYVKSIDINVIYCAYECLYQNILVGVHLGCIVFVFLKYK